MKLVPRNRSDKNVLRAKTAKRAKKQPKTALF
jgi:hypothetical protein